MSRIVALHGNLGSADDWGAAPPADGFTAVDLWGWQERHPGLSLAEFGGRFADLAGDAPRVLVGYSLGGRLALHALQARPQRWRAAILISTHPGLRSAEERRARVEADAAWAKRARESEWADFLGEWNAQPVFGGDATPARLQSQLALERRREAIARAFESWSLGWQEPVDPGAVACPVLWIAGERDERFRALVEGMPGGKWIAPGCGHRVPWERPTELAQVIGTFLRGLD